MERVLIWVALNPARCLGLMAAGGKFTAGLSVQELLIELERFDYHYVHWAGAITAAILTGVLYEVIPIYKRV